MWACWLQSHAGHHLAPSPAELAPLGPAHTHTHAHTHARTRAHTHAHGRPAPSWWRRRLFETGEGMGVWLVDCGYEIPHNLLAVFFTPPPATCTMFKDLSRALHVKYCPPWKPASSAYLSPSSIHELVFIFCVCVLFCLDFSPNFTFFVCLFVLELSVLLPILHLTPSPPISSKIFFKKKAKVFFFSF